MDVPVFPTLVALLVNPWQTLMTMVPPGSQMAYPGASGCSDAPSFLENRGNLLIDVTGIHRAGISGSSAARCWHGPPIARSSTLESASADCADDGDAHATKASL